MVCSARGWKHVGILILGVVFWCVIIPLSGAVAEDHEFSVHIWGSVSPFMSGGAGKGSGSPDYYQAFREGWGGAIELERRFSGRISLLGGIGYEEFSGETYEHFEFDDLDVVPIYLGFKFHLFPSNEKLDSYLRADVGMAHLSAVDVKYSREGLKGRYWDSSWASMFAVGIGAEYRFGRFGIEGEVKVRRIGAPDSSLGDASDAGEFWTVPVRVGLVYHF